MNYSVSWRPRAEGQLVALWADHPDAMPDAADAVDRLLAEDPTDLGESRQDRFRRLWFHPPLCVAFRVDDPARRVHVDGVRWIGG